jgi:hypothetical protein
MIKLFNKFQLYFSTASLVLVTYVVFIADVAAQTKGDILNGKYEFILDNVASCFAITQINSHAGLIGHNHLKYLDPEYKNRPWGIAEFQNYSKYTLKQNEKWLSIYKQLYEYRNLDDVLLNISKRTDRIFLEQRKSIEINKMPSPDYPIQTMHCTIAYKLAIKSETGNTDILKLFKVFNDASDFVSAVLEEKPDWIKESPEYSFAPFYGVYMWQLLGSKSVADNLKDKGYGKK